MYPVLRRFVRLVVHTFFRQVEVVGVEGVPSEGPVIFAGNHPNALMDGLLLIASSPRHPIRFVANAKLWSFRGLALILDALGAVPVYPKADHGEKADSRDALEELVAALERGDCMGIFPEGISHEESRLQRLKSGTSRIALRVAEETGTTVHIVPCGLTYVHRHRFRSRALLELGEPIAVDTTRIEAAGGDSWEAAKTLTSELDAAMRRVTLNAPDWTTLRFAHAARRLYKPTGVFLSPEQWVELSRRFVSAYLEHADDPEVQDLRRDIENYQSRLDLLGLQDHQLRREPRVVFSRALGRAASLLLITPLALPGALLHLPVGWVAATAGNRLAYGKDDVATLKVIATLVLLPLIYLGVAALVGSNLGWLWGLATFVALPLSGLASLKLLETEVSLTMSLVGLMRLASLDEELDELRTTRAALAERVQAEVDRRFDGERIFPAESA